MDCAFLVDGVTGEVPSAAVQEVDYAGSNGNTDPKTDGHTASNFYSYREATRLCQHSVLVVLACQSVWDEDHVVTDADSLGYIPSGIPYDSNWAVTFIENVYLIDHQYREPVSLADAEVESSAHTSGQRLRAKVQSLRRYRLDCRCLFQ